MYKRKIEEYFIAWKNKSKRKPLVVKGCRQCGKTSSVVDFAKRNYKNVIYLDFHEHQEYKSFFAGDLDTETITTNMTIGMMGVRFVAGDTCLIFDEIQDCPRARASLKFFCLDGRYDVLCTGSLLGVNGYKTKKDHEEEDNASIPVGYEEIVTMYPMDFEEWLWANGIQKEHIDLLQQHIQTETPVNEAIHNRMRQLLLQYVIVGGMPEAVGTFLTTHDMGQTRTVQVNIIEDYKSDMVKYALSSDKPRIRECFESIPKQLARENKKFTYSVVRSGGKSRDYAGSLQWIENAGIVHRCYNMQIPELPLDGNAIQEQFKVYMTDTGLFISMLEESTAWSVMQGQLGAYKGAIYENLFADIMGKMGRKLYYFRKESGLEIDFVMRYKGECVIVECKARTGNAKSMSTVLKHPEKYHINHAIKLGDYNVGHEGAVLTLPFYMGFLLREL